MALRTVGIRLTAEIADYQAKLRTAGQTTRDFKGELDKAAKGGNLDAVANRAAGVGVALSGMAALAIKANADFEKAMSGVAAATHAPAAEIAALRAAAIQAGQDTQFSATQAAEGITELSKAGVSTAAILGGGLKGALALAAAGQLSVAEAAETSASALTQFKLSGDKVPHVADLLAAGAGKAQGSVHDMGQALNQSGLVAAQFGLSIEDTTGVLAEFASAGLTGSDAGTSFKTMLLALANPSKATRDLMNDLGISFYDAQGKFVGLSGVAQILQTRLKDLTVEQRNQALGQIFGNDAIRSASDALHRRRGGRRQVEVRVNDAGYAAQTAAKLTDNLAGDVERLKGNIETLAIQSGGGANSGLRILAKTLNEVVGQLGHMSPATSGALVVIAGVSGALLIGGAAWIKYRKIVAEAQAQLAATGPAGERAAAGLGKVSGALGKVGGWAAAAEAAGLLFGNLDDKTTNVDRLTKSLENLAATGKSAGELKDVFGDNWGKLGRIAGFAESADHGFGSFVNHVAGAIPIFGDAGKEIGNFGSRLIAGTDFDTAKQQMQSLDDSLTNFMTTTGDARKSQDLWNQVLAKSGLDAQQLAELLPNAYKELGTLNTAASQGKGAVGGLGDSAKGATGKLGDLGSALETGAEKQNKYKTQADAVAGAARGEREALGALNSAIKAQTDPVFALIDAQHKMADAHKAATKAVKDHGKHSKEAKNAEIDLAKAAIDLQLATGNLSSTFNGKLDPAFATTLRAAGLTEGQIKDVAKQFGEAKKAADKYDGKYKAEVSAPGVKGAKTDIDKAKDAADRYDAKYTAHLYTSGMTGVVADFQKLSRYQQALKSGKTLALHGHDLAAGGPVIGPGSGTSDSIPARLSNGEHVWTAREVQAAGGHQAVMSMRSQVLQGPGYAQGGPVVWPYPTTAKMTKVPSEEEAASAVTPNFGSWPSSPSAQRGDSGVWRRILATVKASGIHYDFGNAYRPGDPKWHGSGRAIDFMGFNQDRLANYFLARQNQVLELIHRTDHRDYGITRGHYAPMPHQWPLHRNHLHVAMSEGGQITEPIYGVGASGKTYSFGEGGLHETVVPNWQAGPATGGGGTTTVNLTVNAPVGSHPREIGATVVQYVGAYLQSGGELRLNGQKVL
jgi:TP901 family phage tail tape measure protein